MKFSKKSRMSDLIHSNYLLLPVINRFGIRMGLGEKEVGQVCHEHGVNAGFFLEVINAFNDPEYFPEEKLAGFPATMIVDYLQKTHQYYLEYVLPDIESRLDELIESCDEKCENLQAIKKFYLGFKMELIHHIREEEEYVFPYVRHLESPGSEPGPRDKAEGYSIHSFEKEHTQVDEKLLDLKNIIIKYLPPSYDDNICNAFLSSVFQLERDLKDHARIEDKILVPAVKALENKKER